MPSDFQYDVLLSYSSKDKAVLRPLAGRLRQDGLTSNAKGRTLKDKVLLHPSAFILQPFLSGSLAQFLYINWRPADCEQEGLKARKRIAQGKRSETSAALGPRTK